MTLVGVRTSFSRAKAPQAKRAKTIMGKQHRDGSRDIFTSVLLFSSAWCVRIIAPVNI